MEKESNRDLNYQVISQGGGSYVMGWTCMDASGIKPLVFIDDC